MKSVENPIERIYIKEGVNSCQVLMTVIVGEPFKGNYHDNYMSGKMTVLVKDYLKKDEADELHKRLCEIFGIQIKVQKSKIKPVTFAEMVVEE